MDNSTNTTGAAPGALSAHATAASGRSVARPVLLGNPGGTRSATDARREETTMQVRYSTLSSLKDRGLMLFARYLHARGFTGLLELHSGDTAAQAYVTPRGRVVYVAGSRHLVERYIAEQRHARRRLQTAADPTPPMRRRVAPSVADPIATLAEAIAEAGRIAEARATLEHRCAAAAEHARPTCIRVLPGPEYSWRLDRPLVAIERLHDIEEHMTFELPGDPAAAAERVRTMQAKHDRIYHAPTD
jgi:hypothetical protein